MDDQPRPDDEADWSRLPGDPVNFFGLSAGFDARDLKRAYNRLLRRYKPEKHPEEFQRIRAAYETLDQQLRYGVAGASGPDGAWDRAEEPLPEASFTEESGSEHKASRIETPTDPLEALAERLEMTGASPTEEYSRLREQPSKTPADYYALALLGDAIKPAAQHEFVRWLLKGLEDDPNDAALGRLLYGYLASQAPEELLSQVLFACAKQIRGDAFYRITEGAWDRVLRGDRAYRFAPLLRKCEAARSEHEGGDPAIAGRVAFTLHALRFALWKDQTGWADEALEFLEANFDQMPPHLEHELDNLAFVREYIACREEFVDSHPLCVRMDQALEAAFVADPVEADRRMLLCQQELAEKEEQVSEAFPYESSSVHSAFFSLWSWVSEDTAARAALPGEEQIDQQFWHSRIRSLLFDLKQRTSMTTSIWNLAGGVRRIAFSVVLIAAVCFTAVGTIGLTILVGEHVIGSSNSNAVTRGLGLIFWLGSTIVVAILCWIRVPQWIDRFFWDPFCNRMAKRCYRLLWRPLLLEFVCQSTLDFFFFRDLVNRIAKTTDDERIWISHFVQQDFGLAVSALAQKFRS